MSSDRRTDVCAFVHESVAYGQKKCHRKVLREGMCLFHLADKNQKEAELFRREFLRYVEQNFDRKDVDVVDCTGFVFPRTTIRLSNYETPRVINKEMCFEGCQIEASLVFDRVTFENNGWIHFFHASFKDEAKVGFIRSTFKGNSTVAFLGSRFEGKSQVDLSGSSFCDNASCEFSAATFLSEARATFTGTSFSGEARIGFTGTEFRDNARLSFWSASFCGKAKIDLVGANFNDEAASDFGYASFTEKSRADITDARLGVSSFEDVTIDPTARIRFDAVSMKSGSPPEESSEPQDLGRVSFLRTDMRLIDFGNVKWASRPPNSVADESSLRRGPWPSYQHVVTLYQGLRKNYERKLRYTEAADFFVREMELLRTRPRYFEKRWQKGGMSLLNRLRYITTWTLQIAWWRSSGWLSIRGLYFVIGKYGESYRRVIVWSAISILFLYPAMRLRDQFGRYTLDSLALLYFQQIERAFRLFFQVFEPVSDSWDVLFRLWAGLLLAILYISLRRKLERRR